MQQLSAANLAPSGVLVHLLAGHDDNRTVAGGFAVPAGAVATGLLQRCGKARLAPTGCPLEHKQRVRLRVAQCPYIGRGDENEIDRDDRQALHYHRAAAPMPAPTLPSCRSISPVIRAKKRSESLSPATSSSD